MTAAKRLFSTLSALLLTLSLVLFGSAAVAAGDPGLGTDPGRGSVVESDLIVNQGPLQADATEALKSIRRQMYDDPDIIFDGKPLKRVVADQGLTRDQYINGVRWDTDLERSALQRAYEQNIHWGHNRPDGSSYTNASVGPRWPGEILTSQADIATAIADIDRGSWAGERDALIAHNGRFNNDTGHLYNLINPRYTYYGFARVGGVTVGWMNGGKSGDASGTKLGGTYTFETAVSDTVLGRMSVKLNVPSSLNAGQSGTATLTGTGNAQSWIPSIPARVQATYSSSNQQVLTISSTGSYTAVGAGTATITAQTASGKRYTSTVTVSGTAPSTVVQLTDDWNTLRMSAEFGFGQAGDDILVGDWDGDGKDTLGIRRGHTFYLHNTLGGSADYVFKFGRAGDEVLVGDWNGDGFDTLGVRRGKRFFLNDSLQGGVAEHEFSYGRDGDEVLVGNWNGGSADTISVRRGISFFINFDLTGGIADREYRYGRAGDEVLVGDFDGDGRDTVTLRRGNILYVNNEHLGGNADMAVTFGRAGEPVFVGDWNGDGIDTPGLSRVR